MLIFWIAGTHQADACVEVIEAEDPAAPVVLIIPGSGPTDRDGNSPLGIRARPYRLLAEGLGAKGTSTVRIDKRGLFGNAAALPDANAVTVDDYVEDTRAWVKVIRETTGTDCVRLLGHSEGGLVELAIAQVDDPVCGVILVATPGRPLGEVKEQRRANAPNAPLLPRADTAIDALAAGRRVDEGELPVPLAQLFAPAVQGFLISAFGLNPVWLAERTSKPMLIVQGEADLQVGIRDAEILKAAAPSADLVRLAAWKATSLSRHKRVAQLGTSMAPIGPVTGSPLRLRARNSVTCWEA